MNRCSICGASCPEDEAFCTICDCDDYFEAGMRGQEDDCEE